MQKPITLLWAFLFETISWYYGLYHMKLTQEQFLEKSRYVHGSIYDYTKSVYINAYTKVIIICSIHGEFSQKASDHHRGIGCKECGIESMRIKAKNNIVEFITKANIKHDNKFNYSKVEYVNSTTDVIIICPIHGEFKQKPVQHLRTTGCHKCGI